MLWIPISWLPRTEREKKKERYRIGRRRSSGFHLFPSFETVVRLLALQVSLSLSTLRLLCFRSDPIPFGSFWLTFIALISRSFLLFLFYFLNFVRFSRLSIEELDLFILLILDGKGSCVGWIWFWWWILRVCALILGF